MMLMASEPGTKRRAFVQRLACCACVRSRSEPKPQRAGLTRSGLAHHAAPHSNEILAWPVPTYTRVRCVWCCAPKLGALPFSSRRLLAKDITVVYASHRQGLKLK